MRQISLAVVVKSVRDGKPLEALLSPTTNYSDLIVLLSIAERKEYIQSSEAGFSVTEGGREWIAKSSAEGLENQSGLERWLCVPDQMKIDELLDDQIYLPESYWLP